MLRAAHIGQYDDSLTVQANSRNMKFHFHSFRGAHNGQDIRIYNYPAQFHQAAIDVLKELKLPDDQFAAIKEQKKHFRVGTPNVLGYFQHLTRTHLNLAVTTPTPINMMVTVEEVQQLTDAIESFWGEEYGS